jgi:hypothetical protein
MEPETLIMKPVHVAGGGGGCVKVTMAVSTWVEVAMTDSIAVMVAVISSGTIVVVVEVTTKTVVTVRVSVWMDIRCDDTVDTGDWFGNLWIHM